MGDQRIRVEADAQLRGFQQLEQTLGNIESRMQGIATAGQSASTAVGGMLGGGGRTGADGTPAGVAGGAGGVAGGIRGRAMSLGQQVGGALGLGALLAPAFAIRDTIRFNMQALEKAQSMGLSPQAIGAFNREQIGWDGVGRRYAVRKDEILSAASQIAQQGMMSESERQTFFRSAENMDNFVKTARVLGVGAGEMGGYAGVLSKTFDLGPDSLDSISMAFYKGAKMADLPNRGDFLRMSMGYATGLRGLGSSLDQAIATMGVLQALAPKAFKGDDVASLGQTLNQIYRRYVYHGGAGMSPSALARASRVSPRGGVSDDPIAFQMGYMADLLKTVQEFDRSGMAPDYIRQFLASVEGLDDTTADMVLAMAQDNSPEKIRDMLARAARGDLSGISAAARDAEWGTLAGDRTMREQQVQIGIENQATIAATETLGMFEGTVSGATDALVGFTKWLGVAAATSVISGAFSGGLGGVFRGAGGALAGAGRSVAQFGRGAANWFGSLWGTRTASYAGSNLTRFVSASGRGATALSGVASAGRAAATGIGGMAKGIGGVVASTGGVVTALTAFALVTAESVRQMKNVRKREIAEQGSHDMELAAVRAQNPNYRKHEGMRSDYDPGWSELGLLHGLTDSRGPFRRWLRSVGRWFGDRAEDMAIGGGAEKMVLAAADAGGTTGNITANVGEWSGSRGSSAAYVDQSTVNINVASADEGKRVAAGIENEKTKRYAQSRREVFDRVDTSDYYDPFGNARSLPQSGGMGVDGQVSNYE